MLKDFKGGQPDFHQSWEIEIHIVTIAVIRTIYAGIQFNEIFSTWFTNNRKFILIINVGLTLKPQIHVNH